MWNAWDGPGTCSRSGDSTPGTPCSPATQVRASTVSWKPAGATTSVSSAWTSSTRIKNAASARAPQPSAEAAGPSGDGWLADQADSGDGARGALTVPGVEAVDLDVGGRGEGRLRASGPAEIAVRGDDSAVGLHLDDDADVLGVEDHVSHLQEGRVRTELAVPAGPVHERADARVGRHGDAGVLPDVGGEVAAPVLGRIEGVPVIAVDA